MAAGRPATRLLLDRVRRGSSRRAAAHGIVAHLGEPGPDVVALALVELGELVLDEVHDAAHQQFRQCGRRRPAAAVRSAPTRPPRSRGPRRRGAAAVRSRRWSRAARRRRAPRGRRRRRRAGRRPASPSRLAVTSQALMSGSRRMAASSRSDSGLFTSSSTATRSSNSPPAALAKISAKMTKNATGMTKPMTSAPGSRSRLSSMARNTASVMASSSRPVSRRNTPCRPASRTSQALDGDACAPASVARRLASSCRSSRHGADPDSRRRRRQQPRGSERLARRRRSGSA